MIKYKLPNSSSWQWKIIQDLDIESKKKNIKNWHKGN
jgi:hypothetical protein